MKKGRRGILTKVVPGGIDPGLRRRRGRVTKEKSHRIIDWTFECLPEASRIIADTTSVSVPEVESCKLFVARAVRLFGADCVE